MRTDRIAHLYADPGPFASVHVDVSRDSEGGAHQVELYARAVREQLAEQGAPEDLVQTVADRINEVPHEPSPLSRVVVATERGVLLDELVHQRAERPTVTWDVLPDVTAWIEAQDGTVPFVLALVDHEGGDVATYRSDLAAPDEQVGVGSETEHVHKVPGGGWSHLKYQNTSDNVWARNASAVADEVRRHVSEGFRLVVLAGDPKSRSQVREAVEGGPGEVIELPAGGRAEDGGDEALHEAVREVLLEHVVARRVETVHTLKDRLGRGDAVATGLRDVADAFVRGQVDTLLLDAPAAADLQLTMSEHPGLSLGGLEPSGRVRGDLALVAAAAATGAEVVVSPASTLGGSPVAALLRWDQPAEGSTQ